MNKDQSKVVYNNKRAETGDRVIVTCGHMSKIQQISAIMSSGRALHELNKLRYPGIGADDEKLDYDPTSAKDFDFHDAHNLAETIKTRNEDYAKMMEEIKNDKNTGFSMPKILDDGAPPPPSSTGQS